MEYVSQDEPPSDYDSADDPFDEPYWKTKRIKLKRLPDKDYYCSECCKSHEMLALRGVELAYCLNCSRASGSDCYICAKCYSRWQSVETFPHTQKKCLLTLVDLT